jgi:hypothetical protein
LHGQQNHNNLTAARLREISKARETAVDLLRCKRPYIEGINSVTGPGWWTEPRAAEAAAAEEVVELGRNLDLALPSLSLRLASISPSPSNSPDATRPVAPSTVV